MEPDEVVKCLGYSNGRFARPLREEEVCHAMPYFEIKKNYLNRLCIECHNYKGHDNEPRMETYRDYFQSYVLPNVCTSDICGFYNIELHDSYTYLKKDEYCIDGLLTFSKFKLQRGPVLIPDPYMVHNWGNQLSYIRDTYTWETKTDTACFYGTTTGDICPDRNKRIGFCFYTSGIPEFECKITKVAQIPEADVIQSVGKEVWKKIYHPEPIHPNEQMKHKFLINIDGNTCRFDVWNYLTNSLTLKSKSNEMLWYYPLLLQNEHFIQFDHLDIKGLQSNIQYLLANPQQCKRIVENSQQFAKTYMKPIMHLQYSVALFESFAENK